MEIPNNKNHSENNQLFGLLPVRFLYKLISPEHVIPETEVDRENAELKEMQEKIEKQKTVISNEIDAYNEEYSSSRRRRKVFETAIGFNSENPMDTVAQIDRLLSTPYVFGDRKNEKLYTLANPHREHRKHMTALLKIRDLITESRSSVLEQDKELKVNSAYIGNNWPTELEERKRTEVMDILGDNPSLDTLKDAERKMKSLLRNHIDDKEYAVLRAILGSLQLQIKLLETPHSGVTSLDDFNEELSEFERQASHAHGERLAGKAEAAREDRDLLASWEKKDGYNHVVDAYSAAENDSEFESFSTGPDGRYSALQERESRQLFLSILSVETNNFDIDFVLGPDFTEDHDENKKRFPYLFEEWAKYNDITSERVDRQLSNVRAIEAEIENTGINDAEKIIKRNGGAGVDTRELDAIPKRPKIEYWQKREVELNKLVYKLRRAGETDAEKSSFRISSDQLEVHRRLAEAQHLRFSALRNRDGVYQEFTRSELSKPGNRQLLTELAMHKYQKAMKMIDEPIDGQGTWQLNYHPAVRRLLIADRYQAGVSAYHLEMSGGESIHVYDENINPDNYWVLSALSQSEYFNRLEKGAALDQAHREILLVARMANKASVDIEHMNNAAKALKLVIAEKAGSITAEQTEALANYRPKELIKELRKYDATVLEGELTETTKSIVLFEKFIEAAKIAINNPYSTEARALINDIESGTYNKIISAVKLDEFRSEMKLVELNYHAMDMKEKSRMGYLETLGIRIESFYAAYEVAVGKNPEMDVENWDEMFLSKNKEGFDKLTGLFEELFGESNTEGEEDFLAVFKTMHGFGPHEKHPEMRNDQAMAISVYSMLKLEIRHRNKIKAATERGEADVLAKLNGMTVGDKITQYGKSVIDMIIGPGQSWANRGAGLVIAIGAWKLAKKALKGQDNMGKGLRFLFLAGAAELAVKHVSGRGILERVGLETVAEAIEGSYKAVLVQQGNEYMDGNGIEKREHTAALYELDKVPFDQVMDWYKSSDENGMPKEGAADMFPKSIDTSAIITRKANWTQENVDLEARRVLWHTARNFFSYVGAKEGKTAEEGRKMLDERWVSLANGEKGDYTEFGLPSILVEQYRSNPSQLTWKAVMQAEIDPQDAEDTKGQEGMQPIWDYLWVKGEEIWRWGRKELYGPLTGNAEEFFNSFQETTRHDIKEFLVEMGEAGAETLHFTKERVSFWYENNKYEIRRFGDMHWELVKQGVKLPFQVLYAVDQAAVPWTLTKLKQINEIALGGMETITGPLTIDQIASPEFQAIGMVMPPEALDATKNPQFRYFGYYQKHFVDAFRAGNRGLKKVTDMYSESPDGIGYYVDQTNFEDAYINPDDKSLSPEARFDKMQTKAREEAKQYFLGKDPYLTPDQVDDLMYPIHVTVDSRTPSPRTIYTYWRMPLSKSPEFFLKDSGHWPDYNDPNRHKDRPPFIVDPSKGFLENLKIAFTLNTGATRTVLGEVGAYAAQVLRLAFGSFETLGNIVQGAGGLVGVKKGSMKWIDDITERGPETEQGIDEFLTSAKKTSGLARPISDFYKNRQNADAYRALHDYAKQQQKPLYLGPLEGLRGYEGTMYLERPSGWNDASFKAWYAAWKTENSVKTTSIDAAVKKMR